MSCDVTRRGDELITAIAIGPDVFFSTGGQARFSGQYGVDLRIAAVPGTVAAIAQAGPPDQAVVVNDKGKKWESGSVAYGEYAVAIRANGDVFDVAWVTGDGHVLESAILTADLRELGRVSGPSLPGGTTQGISRFDLHGLQWMDQHKLRVIDGINFSRPFTDGRWTVGLHDDNYVLLCDHQQGRIYIHRQPTQKACRVVEGADGLPTIAVTGSQKFLWLEEFEPYEKPATPKPPPPEPQPAPTPEPDPMPEGPSRQDIVDAVRRAKDEMARRGYPLVRGGGEMTPDEKRVACYVTVLAAGELLSRFPDAGLGLEHYGGASGIRLGDESYSFDILLLGRSGPSCDVLAGGTEPAAQISDEPLQDDWRSDWRPIGPALVHVPIGPVTDPQQPGGGDEEPPSAPGGDDDHDPELPSERELIDAIKANTEMVRGLAEEIAALRHLIETTEYEGGIESRIPDGVPFFGGREIKGNARLKRVPK